jgi:hypothetical protein
MNRGWLRAETECKRAPGARDLEARARLWKRPALGTGPARAVMRARFQDGCASALFIAYALGVGLRSLFDVQTCQSQSTQVA